MNKVQALHSFWSSFGLTAYEENSVPDNATFPYITYQVNIGEFDRSTSMVASLWYRESTWKNAVDKSDEVFKRIGKGGLIYPCSDGVLWISRGVPFAQQMGDDSDDLIKRVVFTIIVEYVTTD